MLDHDEGVAAIAETRQDFHELLDVGKVQAGGGFVEHVEGAAGGAFAEFGGEFDPLGFAAGEGVAGLAELDVGEAGLFQSAQFGSDDWVLVKEPRGFRHRHVEHFGDAAAFVRDLQGLAVVAPSAALIAGHVHIGEEVHVDLQLAVALAFLTTPARGVETEAPGFVTAHPRHRELSEELANGREQAGERRGIRARAATDGGLVDDDDFVDLLQAGEGVMVARLGFGAIKMPGKGAHEDVIDQRGFAAARRAGDGDEAAEREGDAEVL